MEVKYVLSKEDRRLLVATHRMLDELLETIDVLGSPEEIEALKEADEDIKRGRVRPLEEVVDDLNKKGRIWDRCVLSVRKRP